MLTVSLGATSYLARLLDEVQAPPDVAIRLVEQKRQARLSLRIDHPHPEDAIWKQGERTVLAICPQVQRRVANELLQVHGERGHERLFFAKEKVARRA